MNSDNNGTKNVDWSNNGTTSGIATPLSSPTKLAPHHNIFMANLQRSPTGKHQEVFGDGNGTSLSSSSRVIESLHEQIEILSSTNLQLTMQSQGLLAKLENTQDKESNLVETLSGLKNENKTLKNLLTRETDHLKELENNLILLNDSCNALNKENRSLKHEYKQNNVGETSLNDELQMIESQYSSLIESHDLMKRYYDKSVQKLRDELKTLKLQSNNTLESYHENENQLVEQLSNFNVSVKEYEESYQNNNASIDKIFREALQNMTTDNDKPSDPSNYSTYKEEMIELGSKMGIATVERDLNDLQTVKMRKVRNVSGNGSSNRTSFYGSMALVTDSKNTDVRRNISPIVGLPGVKRSTSVRRSNITTPSKMDPTSSSPSPSPNPMGNGVNF
ncbi:similar to Saccharomyces cerevisiae YBR130C SHE3 Protein that acts as an adaptor between Myo4p and the She2p-mRNA complex [Maudiozyma barnettii]|uniref:SWI5-dependent HO expression protein 3 n=1 Tax=Maudiozyma barnettii TaxID=61262 RepID=A0A8H2ZF28_9SACH|nr:She3p [Kazachstania barnettii]CAB4251914.1 similar to Saccharomyces cerevisiae YBR130C SHE3 Protein that acts as an adaptor between Myo4p and the She2p-mRNA complex [Kazachstania barnettii]CAD1778249.1 similar to Saccharomyces cerevisiae YBR130C SHE3 Protein that acts as an adaptor between Myo4p and the She2p-mRNA complex [Kazachstania barnettii]